jgi:glutamate/tyrosine decarboxylase-like PLP-dependent enzyme
MDGRKQEVRHSGLVLEEDEMRRLGYAAVDLIVERWSTLRDGVPWAGATRDEMETRFREDAPEEGSPHLEVMERATKEVMHYAGRIDHPRFLAFVPSSPTWPTVMADLLATGFNVFQGTWLESAGPSQIELVVLDWFRDWLGLPVTAGGVFTSGGSAANLDALVTARASRGHPAGAVLYHSDQAHSSLGRAARIAGFPSDAVRCVPTDAEYRLDLDALRQVIRRDREAGLHPLMVTANGGATNTGAVDPLRELGGLCKEEGLWMHVDAAYGGFAVLTDEGRIALDGIDLADSVTLDPHKWLFQSYETGCLLVRDATELESAFSTSPEYLQDTQMGRDHVNFGERGLQLSRSFRALKVWMSIKSFGVGAFRAAIQGSIDLAREAGRYVSSSAELELLSPVSLGVVCYRFNPDGHGLDAAGLEALNAEIQERIISSGYAMVSSTRLRGIYSLRICVMNYTSTLEDVLGILRRAEEIGREIGREIVA